MADAVGVIVAVRLQYVQARRIVCGLCDQPFVYIYTGVTGNPVPGAVQTVVSVTTPLLKPLTSRASKSEVREQEAELSALARTECAGQAPCPNCGCWQLWMFATSAVAPSTPWLYASPFLAFIPVCIASLLLPNINDVGILIWIGSTVLLMVLIARRFSRPEPPPTSVGDQDPRALTIEEFDRLVRACRVDHSDPVQAWACACGLALRGDPNVRYLGLLDLTRENEYPELDTERSLAGLARAN